jgi:hypothetical protein
VLGERDAARREFETVRAQQVPPDVKQTIDGYLSAIASADVTKITGFIEVGGGHDSNVNSATGSSQLAVPSLGGAIFTLDPTATRNADTFTALSGALNLTHKLTTDWSLVGSLAAAMKNNTHEDHFDTLNFDGSIGMRWARGAEAITVAGQFQDFELDYARYRVANGGVAQWQHSFSERSQGTLYAQYANLHYPGQEIRDVNRSVYGAALGHAFNGRFTPVFFGSAYFGQEKPETEGVPQLGHRLAGVRLGGQLRISTGLTTFANLSFERREYGGEDQTFLVTRQDNQSDAVLGVSYLLRPGTTLIGQVAYTDNKSNIQINRFDRTVAGVSLRFSF